MTYDPARSRVVLFGGHNHPTDVYLDDVWEYDGVTWTQRTPVTTVPAGREGAACAWDAVRRKLVVHGGYSWTTGVLDDTWFYSVR